jgi:hypothetical protein
MWWVASFLPPLKVQTHTDPNLPATSLKPALESIHLPTLTTETNGQHNPRCQLVAKRYGKRVMAWAVPKENRRSQFVERNLYEEYWDPALKYVRHQPATYQETTVCDSCGCHERRLLLNDVRLGRTAVAWTTSAHL